MTTPDTAWVAEYRAGMLGFLKHAGEVPSLASVTEGTLDGPAGPLPIRTYVPHDPLPGTVLYLHGGGLIGGSLDTHHPTVAQLAARARRRFVSLGYRLAPEHPWPAPLEDCARAIAVLRPDAVAGDSVGGLLAISAARLAAARGAPPPRALVALYPNADLREDRAYPSMEAHDGNVVELATLHRGLALAFPGGVDRTDQYASPALAHSHPGLPPVLLVTVENDPLRDEGERLAERLAAAGVAVSHRRVPNASHALVQMAGRDARAIELQDRVARFLDETLPDSAPDGAPPGGSFSPRP